MLGLILLYWIGKYFYKLAEEHNKSKWAFTILGIVVYYSGGFVFGLAIFTIIEIVSPKYTDTINEFLFGLIMVPFGILSCYLFYDYLKRSWKSFEQDIIFDEEGNIIQDKSEPVEPV